MTGERYSTEREAGHYIKVDFFHFLRDHRKICLPRVYAIYDIQVKKHVFRSKLLLKSDVRDSELCKLNSLNSSGQLENLTFRSKIKVYLQSEN